MPPRSLSALLKEPFGPFRDSDILDSNLKSTRRKVLSLRSMVLSTKKDIVGLDTTEPFQPESAQYKKVEVSGVLEILDLGWLSESGRRRVVQKVRERDGSNSTLTLEAIYGTRTSRRNGRPGLTVKVTIKAVKNMTAGYLTTSDLPNGLFIKTVDRIISMDDQTFQKSHKFLGRYRALRVLNDIIKYDEENSSEPTPQSDRTPLWFAKLYTRRMREINTQNDFAIHLSSDSSDYESSSGSPADIDQRDRHIKPYRVRALRHELPRDILPLLRRHASWLIQDQEDRVHKRKRKFDPAVWRRWLNRGEDADMLVADEDEEATDVTTNRKGKRKATEVDSEPIGGSSRRVRPDDSHPKTPTPPPEEVIPDEEDARSYDSDFSPESTPDWNPSSEASYPSRPATPDSPTLIQKVRDIGTILYHDPDPPDSSMKWWCPVKTCNYMINLLDLTEENTRPLDQETIDRLKARRWYLRMGWVMDAWKIMARAHYDDHLHRVGVRMTWDKFKRVRLSYVSNVQQPLDDGQHGEAEPRVKEESLEH
ncbi:unnamed protein product [Somion occarium]|uniref:Uncharacterized protein n=1 Tax=Somion occarium TaxID=3059160 RepID=A0ABP1CJC9_9APHY